MTTAERNNKVGNQSHTQHARLEPPRVSSFRARLLVLILLIVIPALGIALYGNFERRHVEGLRIRERAADISQLAATKEQDFINDARQLLATLTQFPFLLLSTNQAFSEGNLANLRKLSPDYANFGLIETNGIAFCSSELIRTQVNLGDRPYFQRVLQTKQFSVGNFQIGRLTGERVINFCYPVFDEKGALQRVLYSSLKLKRLSDALTNMSVPAGGVIIVLDRSGNVLARSSEPEKWVGKNLSDAPGIQRILRENAQHIEIEGGGRTAQLHAATLLTDGERPSLFVIVELPLRTLFAQANKVLAYNFIVLGLIALALWFSIQWYARRFFLKPVGALSDAARHLASGDLSARAGRIEGSSELVRLGVALDEMANSVQQRTTELVASNGALRAQIIERDRAEQQIRDQKKENAQLEEKFLRSQRMESIGSLAGGIAHDLNNAIVPVIMGSQMMRQEDISQEDRARLLDLISASGQRCTEMVKQILSFARGNQARAGSVSIRHLLLEIARMATDTFPKSITVETRISKELANAAGDATELYQVLMNLCVNARDAMPKGGKLTLAAESVSLSRETLASHPEIPPGPYIMLRVADTGAGIPAELRIRIFEPFFTTKAPEKGTGLGLSTVATLVKRYQGCIELESQVGKGTEFRIYLPALVEAEPGKGKSDTSVLPCGNGELILLADDEQMVLELARRTLENYGYRVLTAANGMEAVTRFEMSKNEIKLVVTDTDMPFLDGVSSARAIRNMSSDTPIIVASATKHDTTFMTRADLARIFLLSKPYTVDQLLQAVAAALKKSVIPLANQEPLSRSATPSGVA